MECPLCEHLKAHKHGKMPNRIQRYFCPGCCQTFNERFDTLYYHRHVSPEKIRQVLQATVKAAVCEALATLADWHTILSSVMSYPYR